MNTASEVIAEGSYNYLQKNKLYSTENFKLSRRFESQAYFFEAEILSRIETGEFLKVKVYYELTLSMTPVVMRIEKSLGQRYSLETFEVKSASNELYYEFSNEEDSKSLVKHHSTKHYLSSPAVCTSAVFSLTKKFDSTGRTPITLVVGHNSWRTDEAAPLETVVYADFNNRETVDLEIGGQKLSANCLSLYNDDSLSSHIQGDRVDLMLSKHFSIPYQLREKNMRVDINFLKRMD
ncbi:MAG TPA: hypothetical protein VKY27_04460 [Bacteriovoracaceae bacterium]|nr:hypothetical protein [Bacteriovoracaceae bacterium]